MNARTRLLILGLPLASLLLACGQPQGDQAGKAAAAMPPMPVKAMTLQQQDVPLITEYAARISGSREVEVRARVSGILQKRTYNEGPDGQGR